MPRQFVYLCLILLLCCLAPTPGMAQTMVTLDVVETRNGRRLEGQIIEYDPENFLTILTTDGEEITLAKDEYKRIRYAIRRVLLPELDEEEELTSELDDWRTENSSGTIGRRLRPSLSMGFNGGRGNDRQNNFFFEGDRVYGYNVSGLLLYQLNPTLLAGGGVSFDRLNTRLNESVLSYLGSLQVVTSPDRGFGAAIILTAGYGSPIATRTNRIEGTQGGWLFHPGVGVRFGRTDQTYFTLDLGYRIIRTSYELRAFQGVELRTNNYRRLALRFAATF